MAENISNEQLYDLLRDFKADSNRQFSEIRDDIKEVKRDLRETNQRLGRLEDRVEGINDRVHSFEHKIDGIIISWSTRVVSGILGTSAVSAGAVAYFVANLV